jgi:molybdenum cofactor biosynthesis protein B
MSVQEHKESAPRRPVAVWVVTVSSTRDASTDGAGDLVQKLLLDAGHQVLDRTVVPDDADAIRTLVRGLAGDGVTQAAVLTGGTGMSHQDVTPQAIEALFTRPIPGFGELFRMLSYHQIGSAAMLSRASAGMVGPLLVFSLPGSPEACQLGLEKLILPELFHLFRELSKEAPDLPSAPPPPPPGAKVEAKEKPVPAAVKKELEKPTLPPPSGSLGRLGRTTIAVGADQQMGAEKAEGPGDDLPRGWLRAVYEIGGEVTKGTWPELPEEVEKVSPIIDVLHTSGERGTLKLPSGRTLAVFGWPGLVPGAKVLAIGTGTPVAEIVALHRYPVMTGTTLDEAYGLLPKRSEAVAKVAETVTGRAPKDPSGQLFAVQGDAVWIQRGSRAVRWDGNKERDDGTLKQTLASLVLDWSNR